MLSGLQIDEWKEAYDLLGVPYSASPESIRKAYRRLTKRWHPDRYPQGSSEQIEATQMMGRINEAHSKVTDAPLRFFMQKASAAQQPSSPRMTTAPIWRDPSNGRYDVMSTHSEPGFGLYYWAARIVGMSIGFMIAVALLGIFPARPVVIILRSIVIIAGFGYAFGWFQKRVGNLFIRR